MSSDYMSRSLITFYSSLNAHAFINYKRNNERLRKIAGIPSAKKEFIEILQGLIAEIEEMAVEEMNKVSIPVRK